MRGEWNLDNISEGKMADLGDGKISPLASFYQYDQKGNRIRETYANGDYKKYEYDGRNRLTKVSYFKADGTERRYRYTGYEYGDLKQLTGYLEFLSDAEKRLQRQWAENPEDGDRGQRRDRQPATTTRATRCCTRQERTGVRRAFTCTAWKGT